MLPLNTDSFLINNCLLKKIYLSNKAQSPIRHTFTKKIISGQAWGQGPPQAHP